MTVGTPGFRAERLVEAREARGMASNTLADLIGVAPPTVSAYERGKQTPRPEIMDRIASHLRLPVQFFMRPGRSVDSSEPFFRARSSASKPQRTRAKRRIRWAGDIVNYLDGFFRFPSVSLPPAEFPDDPRDFTERDIEELAAACRIHWRLGDGPISSMVVLAENNGIVTTRGEIGSIALDAFSEWLPNWPHPIVFLTSDKESAVRSRFDVAHELFHLMCHQGLTEKQRKDPPLHKLTESQAQRFAGAFLLPAETFTKELWAPTLDTFRNLKERWGVSIGAMVHRCSDLEIVNERQAKRLWANRARRGWAKREPLDDKLRPEQPKLIRRSFEMLLAEGGVDPRRISAELCLPEQDLETVCGLPPGTLTGNEPDAGNVLQFRSTPSTGSASEMGEGKIIPFPID